MKLNFHCNGLIFHIDGLNFYCNGLLIWGNIRSLGSPTPTGTSPTPPQHKFHSRSSLLFTLVITLSSSFVIVSRVRFPHPLASLHHITLFIHISSPAFIPYITLSSSQTLSLLCTFPCTLLSSHIVSEFSIIPSIEYRALVHHSNMVPI